MFLKSTPLPSNLSVSLRSYISPVQPKVRPFTRLLAKPHPLLSISSLPQTSSRARYIETTETKPEQPQHFEVVGKMKPKVKRLSSKEKRTRMKRAAPTVSQRNIPVECSLRRLGTDFKAFSKLAFEIGLKLQHRRYTSEQFLSNVVHHRRAASELRMFHLKHIVGEPVLAIKLWKSSAAPSLSPKVQGSRLATSISPDRSFRSVVHNLKPNTAPAKWLKASFASTCSVNEQGAKITDSSYNQLLLTTLDQVFRLTGEVKSENYYNHKTRSLTIILTGKDAPLSACCNANMQVKLTEQRGCRVVCTKPNCPSKTVSNFVLPLALRHKLWKFRPLVQAPMSPRQVSISIATGKHRSHSFRKSSQNHTSRRRSNGFEMTMLNMNEVEKLPIFGSERLNLNTTSSPQRRNTTEHASNMLVPTGQRLKIACNPLHMLLAKQKGHFSPASLLYMRGY